MFPTNGRGHASRERIWRQSIPGAPLFVRRMKQLPHGSYCAHAWGLVFHSVIHLSMPRMFQQAGSGPAVVGNILLHLASLALAVSFVGAAMLCNRKRKEQSKTRDEAGITIMIGVFSIAREGPLKADNSNKEDDLLLEDLLLNKVKNAIA